MNQLAVKRDKSLDPGRANILLNTAENEKAFALRAFVVISVLTALAWVLTG